MINIFTYNNIGDLPSINGLEYPSTTIFSVKQSDYTIGYCRRFFVKKINDSNVIEVNDTTYNKTSTILFEKCMIKWILVGPKNNVFSNGKLIEEGVYERNRKAVEVAEIKEVMRLIQDYTQYYRLIKS